MFQALYIEEELINHPQVLALLKRFAHLPQIVCSRYGEVFNRKRQNFRLQKEGFSLILAKKYNNFILKTPLNYGIAQESNVENYYFSHMLNCMYDCRYCFLQGMYRSAHIVLFVNFDDFENAICAKVKEHPEKVCHFFSGYDCDSLALESVSHFSAHFLPLFARLPNAFLELRTKSCHIIPLLRFDPLKNCIVAFSLSPAPIAKALEHKAPSLKKRTEALKKLCQHGWLVGLRFDPLIYCRDFKKIYRDFFSEIFSAIPDTSIHSISFGPFRLPAPIFKNIFSLYPEEKLFSFGLAKETALVSYKKELEEELLSFCREEILQYTSVQKVFASV